MTDTATIQRNPRGSIEWPDGMKPRAILSADADKALRAKYRKLGYRISALTDKHQKIFRLTHKQTGHGPLPSNFIVKHFGTNASNLLHEMRDLARKPNQYLSYPDQQDFSQNARYKHAVYGATDKAANVIGAAPLHLRPRNPDEGGGNYAHDLNAAIFEVRVKFGARDAGVRFQMGAPGTRYKFSGFEWEPDAHPWSFNLDFLALLELERRLKGGSPEDTDAKIDKQVEFNRSGHYKTLGYKSSMSIFASTTEGRTQELMEKVAAKTGGSCAFILFMTIPDWARADHFPEPDGAMFTTPFMRVGHPPLSLEAAIKGGAK